MLVELVIALLLFNSAYSDDVGMENIFVVTRCRAACLDQFSHLIRTEENCHKDVDCLMCWETCEMLNTNFKVWGPMCTVPDICFPGCQTACKSVSLRRNLNETRLSSLSVRSVYDRNTDRILLEWMPDDFPDVKGIIVYAVLLKDNSQGWQQIAQTTSHVVHLRGKAVSRDSGIRLLAANATHLLSYAETTYVNSVIRGYEAPFPGRDNGWGPYLVSLERRDSSHSLLATITWLEEYIESSPIEYEVSWNVIDDAMEVTGHLVTTKNIAVLTLWPDSIYLVQVKRSGLTRENLKEISEPLVIDTKFSENIPNKLNFTTPLQCTENKNKMRIIVYFWILSLSLILSCTVFVLHRYKSRNSYFNKESNEMITISDGKCCCLGEELKMLPISFYPITPPFLVRGFMKLICPEYMNFATFQPAPPPNQMCEITEIV